MHQQESPRRKRKPWGEFIGKVISILSKGDSSNSELSKLFKLTGAAFYRRIYQSLGYRCSYQISASDWFINDFGQRDRIYSLVRAEDIGGKVKVNVCKTIKAVLHNNPEHQKKFSEMAKERARLIRAGTYNAEAEKELCKKYS